MSDLYRIPGEVFSANFTKSHSTGSEQYGEPPIAAKQPAYFNHAGVLQQDTSLYAKIEYANGSALGLRLYDSWTQFLGNTISFGTSGSTYNWAQVNGTGAGVLNAIGPDGLTSAITFKATSGLATLLQSRGALGVLGPRNFSIWARRKTGVGKVELTYNSSGTWVDITSSLTSSWKRFTIVAASGSSVTGVRLTSINDEVELAYPMLYVGAASDETDSHPEVVGLGHNIGVFNNFLEFDSLDPVVGVTIIAEIGLNNRGSQTRISSATVIIDDGSDNYVSVAVKKSPGSAIAISSMYEIVSSSGGYYEQDFFGEGTSISVVGISVKQNTWAISVNGNTVATGSDATQVFSNSYIQVAGIRSYLRSLKISKMFTDISALNILTKP